MAKEKKVKATPHEQEVKEMKKAGKDVMISKKSQKENVNPNEETKSSEIKKTEKPQKDTKEKKAKVCEAETKKDKLSKLKLNILRDVFFLFAVRKCLKAFKVL